MLSVFRRPSVLVFTGVVLTAAFAPRIASAASCAVIDFSAVEQRTQTVINGATVSTLVATPAAAPGDFVVLEADFGCAVSAGFDPIATSNAVTVEVLRSDRWRVRGFEPAHLLRELRGAGRERAGARLRRLGVQRAPLPDAGEWPRGSRRGSP